MANKVYTKEQILDTAYKITRDQDLDALSMRAIARKIGCSVMPIYDSFDSKDDLIKEVNLYSLHQTLYDLSVDTLYDRFDKIVEFGFKYPKFFLDFVRNEKAFVYETDVLCKLCDFMKKDDKLKDYHDQVALRINSRVEAFIVGLVHIYCDEKPIERIIEVAKKIVRDTTEHIIEGVTKNERKSAN
ncbi:TetR/AcrR family transcriptional regulator [Candidatus Izimaplasma bacterium]|nr:TetR/AcrR family transcriptional regulator [Candidatus Izimaplasma bacterium]